MDWYTLLEQLLYGVVYITLYFVIKFLRSKGIIEKAQQIKVSDEIKQHGAKLAVLLAQQVFHNKGNQVKYNEAVSYLTKYLSDRGIKITEDETKMLIESSLKLAKKQFGEEWKK